MTYSSYELKYCERCGGLGLRRSKSGLPYCCDCEQILRAFLLAPPVATATPGQLRRIVHRVSQRVLTPPVETLGVPESARVS